MYANDLRKAMEEGNRAEVCGLLGVIPPDHWQYTGSPVRAEARYESVCIVVQHVSGGTGINTYDEISVNVRFPDGKPESLGKFSAEELRLPNYIPPSQRPSGGSA
jgi:hypothetical protein